MKKLLRLLGLSKHDWVVDDEKRDGLLNRFCSKCGAREVMNPRTGKWGYIGYGPSKFCPKCWDIS